LHFGSQKIRLFIHDEFYVGLMSPDYTLSRLYLKNINMKAHFLRAQHYILSKTVPDMCDRV